MERFKRILVATDVRLDHHPIVEEAAEIAQHNGAELKVVDVVPEFGWTVRLALNDGAHVRELIAREKESPPDDLDIAFTFFHLMMILQPAKSRMSKFRHLTMISIRLLSLQGKSTS